MMTRASTDKITTECPWQTVISKLKHKHSCFGGDRFQLLSAS